jgi:uncharacterized cupin superfamily protein
MCRRFVTALLTFAAAFAPLAARGADAPPPDAVREIDRSCDALATEAAPPAATFTRIFDGRPGEGAWQTADAATLERIARDPNIYSETGTVRYANGRIAFVTIVSSSLDFGERTDYCYRETGTLARALERSAGTMNADAEARWLDADGHEIYRTSAFSLVSPRPGASPSPDLRPAKVDLYRTVSDLPFYALLPDARTALRGTPSPSRKPPVMQQTMLAGIAMWSVWQPDRNLYFNAFFVASPDGNVAIDPLPLLESDAADIDARGGLAWILVTNRDHERDARALAVRFGAKLVCSEAEAPLLSGPVDRTVRPGEAFAGGVVIGLAGLKTPGEIALAWPERRTVLVGDALWGSPAGSVRLMPDEKLADPARAVLSLRALAARHPEHLLVGDGACIFGGAERTIWTALEARRDAYVNRINRDEVAWRAWNDEPPAYGAQTLEIGDFIGAEKLGYRIISLPPGHASAPLHWHASEEELFVVLAGAPTLVTPRGEVALRAGDFIAFPTRAEGAHKLVNRTETACEVLLVANTDARDVCYYPDSHKLMIERSDIIVHDSPKLAYWDGEA